jgi:hypothetical protein
MKPAQYLFGLLVLLLIGQSAWAGSVTRGQFTSQIVDREPVDRIESLTTEATQINYFTELTELQNQTVTHQWVFDDRVIFEKSFKVGGPRWRVWSNKAMRPGTSGTWRVNTLDGAGNRILSQTLQRLPAEQ